eukprot:259552-Rhodomonas_salina.2
MQSPLLTYGPATTRRERSGIGRHSHYLAPAIEYLLSRRSAAPQSTGRGTNYYNPLSICYAVAMR